MGERMILFLTTLSFISGALSSKVPVLIWSPNRPMNDIKQVHTGKTLSSSEFSQEYLKPLSIKNGHTVVVFLQDKLSLEDFARYGDIYNSFSDGGAFKNIRALMDNSYSLDLPSVVKPSVAIGALMKTLDGAVHNIDRVEQVEQVVLDGKRPNIIVVNLNSDQGQSDEETFKANDQKIAMAVQILNKRGLQYSVVYTAKDSSSAASKGAPQARRRLLETDVADNGTFVNKTCMFLYYRSMNLTVEMEKSKFEMVFNSSEEASNWDKSTCSNDTSELNFSFTDGANNVITLNVQFNNSNGYTDWLAIDGTLSLQGKFNNTQIDGSVKLNVKVLTAPRDFSYHCSSFGPILSTRAQNDTFNASIVFDGFQFQPSNIINDQFSDGWDCITFFTEGIWMGLVSVAVLIIILIYGFVMLSAVGTMDKFDDAKGKTITVNVSE